MSCGWTGIAVAGTLGSAALPTRLKVIEESNVRLSELTGSVPTTWRSIFCRCPLVER
jgi:hypothetical protein